MADEENPLGGGPFGVGPFGPLVGAAAVAAAAFSFASVTISQPVTRTLYYQANIAPPPVDHPAPAVVDNINAATGITTGGVRSKTLFYQSKIYGIAPPVVVVDVTPAQWMVPLSRAPTRPPTETALYTPFVPLVAPQPTASQWLQPFKRQVAILPVPAGGSPFVPKEAVLENTVTPDKWLRPFSRAVPTPLPVHTQPVFGYPYEAAVVSNLTTTLEWMQPFYQAAPHVWPTKQVLPFVPKEAVLENTVTPDKWLQAWKGPPRYRPAPQGGSPFIPREAVLENTVTPDKWLVRFQGAVPVPPVHHTQPFLGYPYEAASNLTTTLEWMPAWRGPPNYTPIKVQTPPFVPKAAIVDQVTPDKWLQAWKGPPRAVPATAGGSPFVPKEAVLENTVTPDKWLFRFAKAVPVPKPVPTQPEFRYPYETQAIVVPYEQWWHQPLSRPAARPSVHAKPYQPFVPKEAVLENTQTPDKWLQRWQGPPRITPIKVQTPPFVPREATRENTQTPDKWHRDLGRAVAKRPVTPTQPGWSYAPVVADNTVTIEKWQQPLSRAAAARKARPTQPVYVTIEPEVVEVAEAFVAAETSWTVRYRRSLFYQSRVQPYYPYEQAEPVCIPAFQIDGFQFDAFQTCYDEQEPQIEGGPADEPERVICLLPQSRVAVVPEVLRTATVPVDLRVATVPELSRTVEVLLSDRDEESNKSQTLPCASPIVMPGGTAFDSAFEDDAFQ